MTVPSHDKSPVLIRSRSLIRGVFHHSETHGHGAAVSNSSQNPNPSKCVVTHSWSSSTLSSWADEITPAGVTEAKCGAAIVKLPPIVDDCTDIDHSRRVSIAKSHGFDYDEKTGVQSILESLTPHETKHLADAHMPLRHYRAEKGNLSEAIRKIKATLKWREEFAVEDIKRCFDIHNGTSTMEEVSPQKQNELKHLSDIIDQENCTGKIYCRGYDKEGRAILYLTPGRENSMDEMNNMRHLVYHLERAIACTRKKSGREKFCVVIGYQGFKLSNAPPMSTVKHTLTILQGHYPERMYRAYICDPPLVFRTFWNVIKHFVDPATLEKIAFCSGKEGVKLLEQDFDTEWTEKCAGGKNELREYDYKEFLYRTPFDQTFDEKCCQSV